MIKIELKKDTEGVYGDLKRRGVSQVSGSDTTPLSETLTHGVEFSVTFG
ncbi:MAG: hypothetical protein IJ599_01955 [Alphaproteobacteria bacterium]|nr:hypothetical protein [Alphaproteobacteria bacterium]